MYNVNCIPERLTLSDTWNNFFYYSCFKPEFFLVPQICTKGKVHIFKYLTVQACQIKTADSLYLNAIEPQHLPQPVEER